MNQIRKFFESLSVIVMVIGLSALMSACSTDRIAAPRVQKGGLRADCGGIYNLVAAPGRPLMSEECCGGGETLTATAAPTDPSQSRAVGGTRLAPGAVRLDCEGGVPEWYCAFVWGETSDTITCGNFGEWICDVNYAGPPTWVYSCSAESCDETGYLGWKNVPGPYDWQAVFHKFARPGIDCEGEEGGGGGGGGSGGGSASPPSPVTCQEGYIDNLLGSCVTLTMELCETWFALGFLGIQNDFNGCLKKLTHNDSTLVNAAIAMWADTTTMDVSTALADSIKKDCATGMRKLMSVYAASPSRLFRGGALGGGRGIHVAKTDEPSFGSVIHIEAWLFDSAGVGVASPNPTQIEYRRMISELLIHEGLHATPDPILHRSFPPIDANGRYRDEPFRRIQETLSHRSPCLKPPA